MCDCELIESVRNTLLHDSAALNAAGAVYGHATAIDDVSTV